MAQKNRHTANSEISHLLTWTPYSCCININKEHFHWRLDWEAIYQISASVLCNIGQIAAWTNAAHSLNILKHARPKISLADPMIGPVSIEMPPNGGGMKSNKNDVSHRSGNYPQLHKFIIILEDFFHI